MLDAIPLQPAIIYGPVDSRRLGRSLGLNIMPTGYKVCSFNCIYCHYGWTKYLKPDVSAYTRDLPSVERVATELEGALRTIAPPAYITFSGNGEATLHPDFPAIVDAVIAVRDCVGSAAKTAILSNSTGLGSVEVRRALQRLDVRLMKLDAGTPEVLEKINRPAAGIDLEGITEGLGQLRDITLQSAFVDGEVTNATEEDIETWLRRVKNIRLTRSRCIVSRTHRP
jgi:wyosine [tRNA(Phe)-imidazoG37] synthetase (radical SAM superfamily)